MRIASDDVNRLFPITELIFYGKGIVQVKRESMIPKSGRGGGGQRGRIKYLSARARSYLAFIVAATEVQFKSLLTLTYGEPFPLDGAVCKSHLNAMLTHIRRTYPNIDYVWCVEFQKRGALHYHILLTLDGVGDWNRKDAAYKWASITAPSRWATNVSEKVDTAYRKKCYNVHKHKEQWTELREADGAMRYMTKYCLKAEQKFVPEPFQNVGRFFGMSRNVIKNTRKPVTMVLDTDAAQLLLEVENHPTSGWGVVPKYLFGVKLEPMVDIED